MQEWWPLLAVFWALYLLDGLHVSRRGKVHFWAATGRMRARVSESGWFLLLPLPTAWSLVSEDLPVSLDADGVTNWPSASVGRPPPLPDTLRTWRWEEIETIENRFGAIRINRHPFAPATPALDATALRQLAAQLRHLDPDSRRQVLEQWHARRIKPLRLRRRVGLILGRSRSVAWLNTLQLGIALVITTFVLAKPVSLLPPELANVIGARLTELLVAYALLHLVSIVWWYRLHSRLVPEKANDRFGQVLTGLLVPPQALHVRHHLLHSLARAQHPAAVAMAVATDSESVRLMRNTWADIRWPLRPAGLPRTAVAIASASAKRVDALLVGAVKQVNRRLLPEDLLNAPHRPKDACAWCPRCGDVFVQPNSRCPHGIPLKTWQPDEHLRREGPN